MTNHKHCIFFNRKKEAQNKEYAFHIGSMERGLDYIYKVSRKTVSGYEEIGHDLVELQTYLNELRFQQAEIKAKLQLGESCQKLMQRKITTLNDEVIAYLK